MDERARKADPLLLAAGKHRAPFGFLVEPLGKMTEARRRHGGAHQRVSSTSSASIG